MQASIKIPIASDKLITWLEKRKIRLQKEHKEAKTLKIKINKGVQLKQVKNCLDYIYTHL
jgi:hypothetical protein